MHENSPIAICSHKRSGTHLLAATIFQNFKLPDMSLVTPIHAGKRFVRGEEESEVGSRATIPWGGLWGSHNFYNPKWAKNPDKILYIVRHPVRTMVSYWRFVDPLQKDVPERYLSEGRAKFWYRHAKGYTQNCHWVRYEDLVGDSHDNVLSDIAEWFGLEKKQDGYSRVEERVGWYSDSTPTQSKETVQMAKDSLGKVLPDGFLGYDIEHPENYYVMEGR